MLEMMIRVILLYIMSGYMIGLTAQNEAFYIKEIQKQMGGVSECRVENGRVDLLTDEYAIEVEWAQNWKHSIGQALWYAMQTNRKAGIVLLMKTIEDRKHGIRLQSAIDYAGLSDKVTVWFYPEDFGDTFETVEETRVAYRQAQIAQSGHYSRNRNTGVRHNSGCTYYNCSNCVPCGPSDGNKACGKCGG